MKTNPYRTLPRVDALVDSEALAPLNLSHALKVEAARHVLNEARKEIASGSTSPNSETIMAQVVSYAQSLVAPRLVSVINATGVVIHTNLGRAPLTAQSLASSLRYSTLEYDLEAGKRGSRRQHVETLLCDLSGAEAAFVVNNNAAAVMLMLAALAKDREVLISRSELVEIGGSFRVPEIMSASGAKLKEVGTTNRTYAKDYEAAITPQTAAILKVHRSNFRVTGFTHEPETQELVDVAARHGLMTFHDLGCATFAPLPESLNQETTVGAELETGLDVLCFSGDKVLGGPQAGILLGKKEVIDRLARHPMARALRVDKLTLSCLQSTLLAYRLGEPERVPVTAMLHMSEAQLMDRARRLAKACGPKVEAVPSEDPVGGGSHPDETLPGAAIAITLDSDGALTAMATELRRGDPSIVGVIRDHRLHLHLRTVSPEEEAIVESRLKALL